LNRLLIAVVAASLTWCGCGGGGSHNTQPPPQAQITISPATPQIRAGGTQAFTAQVSNSSSSAVTWGVNGTNGGNCTVGTIDANGLYTAPASLPTPNTVTVSASLSSNSSVTGNTIATLLNPVPAIASASVAAVISGAYGINVTGSGFVNGTKLLLGGNAIQTTVLSPTLLTAQALGLSANTSFSFQLSNPDPGGANSNTVTVAATSLTPANVTANSRLLDQASWGPTLADIAHVQSIGLQGWIDEQFAALQTQIPLPPPTLPVSCNNSSVACVQQSFFQNALRSPDQLRQRVAFALSQIFVISAVEIPRGDAMASYFNMLSRDAFGNYLTIMKDVTLSPGMGTYLNMVNSDKPNVAAGQIANENYARELMQLFTLGTSRLNPDGTPILDSSGQTIQPYSEAQVQAFAKAYTGWTYARSDGATPAFPNNTQYFLAPMVPLDSHHDMSAKTLLNTTLPAGQTAQQDLDGALNDIFNHPNVGPFVARQLILHLVSSNPSPAYIGRVAAKFNDNGSGVRGDMKAVIRAILMDDEARRGDNPANANAGDGHLREPVLYITNLLRGLSAQASDPNLFASTLQQFGLNMGQRVMYSPSVFNYFSPDYIIPGTATFGPEFQLLTTATTVVRQNFVDTLVKNQLGGGTAIDLTTLANLASNPQQLVDTLDAIFTHGALPSSTDKAAIISAINAVPASNPQARARLAVYLLTSSSQYQVIQ
jgi:uncharacterized protein (DUF1800 family)